jgi:signal transduction histidine kinase
VRHWLDGLIVALAVLAQVEVWTDAAHGPRPAAALAALLWTLPLLWHRRFPLVASAAVFVTLGLESLLPGDEVTSSQVNALAIVTAFGVAGTHASQRSALAGGAIGFASLATIILAEVPDSEGAVPIFLLGAGTWALARIYAERGRRAEQLEQRARRLEQEHQALVLGERARIARELHDVVAHSISVMTIQAGAARLLLDEDPGRARAPLTSVEETGRQALAEMRRLLGVLRGTDDEATLAPQPGMAQLEALVAQVESAGLPVRLTVEGEPRPLGAGVDLTAYRIIQEALTNVLRHAGSARAHVHVRYLPSLLELEVRNSGQVSANGHGGHGVIGMRQRVEVYGGEFEAGPAIGGGYRVSARIPLDAAG